MAKSSFEVGEKEKHTLTVVHDWVMKRILIELDGEKLADEYHYSPFEKTFSFDVGSSEVHKVEVSLGRFLYFKGREVKVLVDGKPARRGGEDGIGATPADSLRLPRGDDHHHSNLRRQREDEEYIIHHHFFPDFDRPMLRLI